MVVLFVGRSCLFCCVCVCVSVCVLALLVARSLRRRKKEERLNGYKVQFFSVFIDAELRSDGRTVWSL